jgi:phytoene synthase
MGLFMSDLNLAKASSPIAVLRQHGRSFYWASWFLGRKKAMHAARLYAFCRAVDDIADKHHDPIYIIKTLKSWQLQIQQGVGKTDSVNDVLALANELSLDTASLSYLLDGLMSDVTQVRIADQDTLLQYAFLVAGTVGLMMCHLLGAHNPEAKKFAVDLGIAMQLTNILRDVAEDAAADRQYIPAKWLNVGMDLFNPDEQTRAQAKPVFKQLHELSERYYESAYAGLHYLPLRSRLSIRIAARLYQEIGLQAKQQQFAVLNKRMVVSPLRKSWLVLSSCVLFIKDLVWQKKLPKHNAALHQAISSWVSAY